MPAEIPFTQAEAPQQFSGGNPLQMMGQMQEMAQRGEAMQQQQMMNRAQLAYGRVLQQHIDPETGEVDTHGVLTDVATHPETVPMFSTIAKDLLAQGHAQQTALEQRLKNQKLMVEITANNAASELDSLTRTGDAKGALASFVAKGRQSGSITENQALQMMQNPALRTVNGLTNALKTTAMQSELGLKALEQSGLDLKNLTRQIEYVDDEGNTRVAPAYAIPGALTPGQQAQFGGMRGGPQQGAPSQSVAQGGSAPPAIGAAGQEPQPSGAPAAYPGYIKQGVLGKKAQDYAEGKGPWADTEKEVNMAADQAIASQRGITEARSLVKEIKDSGGTMGPTAGIRAKATSFLDEMRSNLGPNAEALKKLGLDVNGFLGSIETALSSDDPKKWLAAAQAMDKLSAINAVSGTKASVGPGSRITTPEVMKFMEIFPSLTSSPEGLERMYRFMEKLNKSAVDRQKFMNFYREQNKHHHHKGYNPSAWQQEWEELLEDHGDVKFENEGGK